MNTKASPHVALLTIHPLQVVVIPIPNSKLGEEAVKAMLDRADAIAADLKAAGAECWWYPPQTLQGLRGCWLGF